MVRITDILLIWWQRQDGGKRAIGNFSDCLQFLLCLEGILNKAYNIVFVVSVYIMPWRISDMIAIFDHIDLKNI